MREDQFPMIDKYVKNKINTVLDKIRAEIEASRWTDKNIRIERNALASGLDKALEIIDKYKVESEDKERTGKKQ